MEEIRGGKENKKFEEGERGEEEQRDNVGFLENLSEREKERDRERRKP